MKIVGWVGIFTICAFMARAQSDNGVLSASKIIKLIPNKVNGFFLSSEPIGRLTKVGDMKYAVAEKRFSASRRRAVKILLFDYKEAPIMYNQATIKFYNFTPVESDSLILKSLIFNNCKGWESFNVYRKNSQILLGIRDRFFLSIEGTNVDLEALKRVMQEFKFETFPK